VAPPPRGQHAAAAPATGGQAHDPIPSTIRKAETDAHARLNQIQRRAEVAKTDVFKIVASLLSVRNDRVGKFSWHLEFVALAPAQSQLTPLLYPFFVQTSSPSSAAKGRPQSGKRGEAAALQTPGGTSGAAASAATSANVTSMADQQSAVRGGPGREPFGNGVLGSELEG
jgi:hypothetical protein